MFGEFWGNEFTETIVLVGEFETAICRGEEMEVSMLLLSCDTIKRLLFAKPPFISSWLDTIVHIFESSSVMFTFMQEFDSLIRFDFESVAGTVTVAVVEKLVFSSIHEPALSFLFGES